MTPPEKTGGTLNSSENEEQKRKMRWVILIAFLSMFILVFILTTIAVFFPSLVNIENQEHESFAVKLFIGEMAALVLAICYQVFGIKRNSGEIEDPNAANNVNEFPNITDEIYKLTNKFDSIQDKNQLMLIDSFGANTIEAISKIFQDDEHYIAKNLLHNTSTELRHAKKIMATDVLGPEAWITPTAYLYLANQIKYYVKGNVKKGEWSLVVSKQLGKAIDDCCEFAKDKLGQTESNSLFDNPTDFSWTVGEPSIEFSRILRWSREELLSPIAESVINIHSAFHVPLFFYETSNQEDKKLDYILFEQDDGLFSGFFSSENKQFRPTPINTNGVIPGNYNAVDNYKELLNKADLMLAIDAREYFKKEEKSKRQIKN